MAKIRIAKIDEEKSKPSGSQPTYVAVLSDKLDQTRINNLDSLRQRNRNSNIMNLEVNVNPGNILTFDTKAGVTVADAVATIQGWLAEVSGEEEQFKQGIRDLNEKLAAEKSAGG